MAKRKEKATGSSLFETYYASLYQARWERLKASLLTERNPVAFSEDLTQPYYLDEASILGAKLLDVQSGDSVLDMCAAPGGKTLVLASALQGTGHLVSNDRSANRRLRLKQVLASHLAENLQNNITVTSHDASRWSLYEQQVYDRILLDAPCSSERHVLSDGKALSEWTCARPKHLAIQQFAMLASALEAVKVGGYILYSTCSINPNENEMIIEKLHAKRAGRFSLPPITLQYGEELKYGSIILPDTGQGRGPLYVCLIRRII
ncbi:MAG: RsmB/NOP family class I SAM-dependent RNA methyltransferase [Sphaerochaeta sp.]|uniref:RsmB/NOP family class I SAM-dependent RNA methyltransferase n=1 Tax=Sphaerochaeta sp. TaxID=1972642 RepID=UPI002FCBE6BA